MNEVSERVLLKFATLLKNNPNGNVPFLWVQAGGRVASQQNVQRTCATCGASLNFVGYGRYQCPNSCLVIGASR